MCTFAQNQLGRGVASTRGPFDSITTEYQTILTTAAIVRTTNEQSAIRQKYIEMHLAIERLMLDQGKGYIEASEALAAGPTTASVPLRLNVANNNIHISG